MSRRSARKSNIIRSARERTGRAGRATASTAEEWGGISEDSAFCRSIGGKRAGWKTNFAMIEGKQKTEGNGDMRRILAVACDRENYEYDIHALVQSFYPEYQVTVAPLHKLAGQERPADILITFGEGWAEAAFWAAHTYRGEMPEGDEKRGFKRFFYRTLCKETGKSLPWGNLTGIRPTKIAMELLEKGESEETVRSFLREEHFVSGEKSALCLAIAKREKEILKKLHAGDGYSLYIGIPFCPSRCLYCSFTSYPLDVWEKRMDEYLDCLMKEIDYVAEAFASKTLDTIYIGGGTPTSLSPERLERLLCKLERTFELPALQEFTVEAGRADSITREKLQVLKRRHVTRISVNPQTMKEETLRLIGRRHTVGQVREAFAMAREEGFDNINMDLILGLPGEDADDVRRTLQAVTQMNPDNLTVHSLAVKRASKLGQWIEENGADTMNNTDETMAIAAEGAAQMGMQPYYLYRQKNMAGNFENTGYAKPGKHGIYNILIMEEKQSIVALGAGSISKRVFADGRIERCENVKDILQYMERIDEMIARKRRMFSAPEAAAQEQPAGVEAAAVQGEPEDEEAACLGRIRAILRDCSLTGEQKLAAMDKTVWELIRLLQGKTFSTAKGLTYCFAVRGNEIFVSRKSKSITRATVRCSLKSVIALRDQGKNVEGPKMIGTFGASYLYPVFEYMGLIRD